MKKTMGSRERVIAAIRREPTDRVPVFMWYHPATRIRLAEYLEIPPGSVDDALFNDVRQVWVGNNFAMEGIIHEKEGESHTDAWGITWTREGFFNQIAISPLSGLDADVIRSYSFPHGEIDSLLANMDTLMAGRESHFIGCDISPCLFEIAGRLRGMEDALADIAVDPEAFGVFMGHAADFARETGRRACERYRPDWLWTGDDVGGQGGMMMSPASWRELIKPHLAGIFRVPREMGITVAYHSCGAIREIIPDLVEIGLDVLNPVQCNCSGMDPIELKREFGRDLTFMGGIDTQELLPRGTALEVRKYAEELISVMSGDGGGYILAASHTVPPETPMDNIMAMYEAAGIGREMIFDKAAGIRGETSGL